MFPPDQYELLDFGDGRRLERFGPITLDRPCPAAEGMARADPAAWAAADARFERTEPERGTWSCRRELPDAWSIACGPLVFELKRTVFGHLGVFPEQAANWRWLAEQLGQGAAAVARENAVGWDKQRAVPPSAGRPSADDSDIGGTALRLSHPTRVLNLFAYTGGSTLAAARAGAEVVHVDAAQNIVAWARRNAQGSGLAKAPIRWIAEDALKFVKRELRRGNSYDAVILDPPSYGHGARGEVWRLSSHLPRLLELCGKLTAGRRRLVLLTAHTPDFPPARLEGMMIEALERAGGAVGGGTIHSGPLLLRTVVGRQLPSGAVVRWSGRVAGA